MQLIEHGAQRARREGARREHPPETVDRANDLHSGSAPGGDRHENAGFGIEALEKIGKVGEWIRVRDYREQQLGAMPNVAIYRESALSVDDVLAVGANHVAIATGAHWRRERFDGAAYVAVAAPELTSSVLTADDIMAGTPS
jgi:hypothetical protein